MKKILKFKLMTPVKMLTAFFISFFVILVIASVSAPKILAQYQCASIGGSCTKCVGGPDPQTCYAECDTSRGWYDYDDCPWGAQTCTAECDCKNNTAICYKCNPPPSSPTCELTQPANVCVNTSSTFTASCKNCTRMGIYYQTASTSTTTWQEAANCSRSGVGDIIDCKGTKTLAQGTYNVVCNAYNDTNGEKCSGNPWCSVNGCTQNCVDCGTFKNCGDYDKYTVLVKSCIVSITPTRTPTPPPNPVLNCTGKTAIRSNGQNIPSCSVDPSKCLVSPGEIFTYGVGMKNSSSVTAKGAIIVDTLPEAVTFNNVSNFNCSVASTVNGRQVVQCPVGDVAAGATKIVLFQVKVKNPIAANSYTNIAKVSYTTVSGLPPSSPSCTHDIKVGASQCDYQPVDLMLVMDRTGSMQSKEIVGGVRNTKLYWSKQAAKLFVNKLSQSQAAKGGKIRVGVASFGRSYPANNGVPPVSILHKGLTNLTNLSQVLSAIDSVNYIGDGTCITCGEKHAVLQIQSTAGDLAGVKNVAVVFTDGKGNKDVYGNPISRTIARDQAVAEILKIKGSPYNAQVYVAAYTSVLSPYDPATVKAISSGSGFCYVAPDSNSWDDVLSKILNNICGSYGALQKVGTSGVIAC